jgi:hypothetical protein
VSGARNQPVAGPHAESEFAEQLCDSDEQSAVVNRDRRCVELDAVN